MRQWCGLRVSTHGGYLSHNLENICICCLPLSLSVCIFNEHVGLLFVYNINSMEFQPHVFAGPLSPGANSKDYSALRLLGNRNLSWESPHISTRQHQTPYKGIGTLSAIFATQEVLKKILMAFCTSCLFSLFSVAS